MTQKQRITTTTTTSATRRTPFTHAVAGPKLTKTFFITKHVGYDYSDVGVPSFFYCCEAYDICCLKLSLQINADEKDGQTFPAIFCGKNSRKSQK